MPPNAEIERRRRRSSRIWQEPVPAGQ